MNETLKKLIEALRDELKEYGELLALLDQQQGLIVQRASEDLLGCVARIESETETLRELRETRDRLRGCLAQELGCPPGCPFTELIGLTPGEYRGLLHALVDENNQLLFRVQQRTRQNHLLLTRSMDLMQRLIRSLAPDTGHSGAVYGVNGTRPGFALPTRGIYEAVG